MARVGKRCSACGVNYVGERMQGKLCPWCSKARTTAHARATDIERAEALEL